MTIEAIAMRIRRFVHRSALMQVGLLLLFGAAGDAIVRVTGLPLPGGVVGLALVLALLGMQRLHPGSLRRGAQWLLGNMLLFFVPAVLALLNHEELLGLLGLKLLAIILVGTAAVMAVTALTVEACARATAHVARKSVG